MSSQKIQGYIHRINRNDETLTEIDVDPEKGVVTDADLASLMAALENNPEAARRVIAMTFILNKNLSSINIPEVMTSLRSVSFSFNTLISLNIHSTLTELQTLNFMPLGIFDMSARNELSLIAKITLNKFHTNNPNVNISVDFNLEEFTSDQITIIALKNHFQNLLNHIGQNIYSFNDIRNMPAQDKLGKLPSELIDMAFEFLSGNLYPLESEITTLKNVFPERGDIISEFQNSNEFKNIKHEFLRFNKVLGETAVLNAKHVALEAENVALEAENVALKAEAVAFKKKRNAQFSTGLMSWISGVVDNLKSFLLICYGQLNQQ